MKISGKTVLITGACSGIGKIMARRCLEKDAKQVIIWDINQEAIAATVEELSEFGHVHGFKADISDTASIDTAFQATKIGCGDVDILINNAGIITKGAMFLTLRFLPGMQARECGHICNITSSAGMLALPKMSLYAASKWAAIGWSESLRIELAREKSPVKVTTIAPYFINTGMFDGIHSFFKIQNPEVVARKTIWAIQHDLGYRGIPFSSHFIRLMQGIFPYRLFNWLFGDVCGLYTVMDHFTGRQK